MYLNYIVLATNKKKEIFKCEFFHMKQNKKSPIFKHIPKKICLSKKKKKNDSRMCIFSMKRDSIIYLLPKMRCGMDFFFALMERVGWQ